MIKKQTSLVDKYKGLYETGQGWYPLLNALINSARWHIDSSREQRARALRYNRLLKKAINGDRGPLTKYLTFGTAVTPYTLQTVEDAVAGATYRAVPKACPPVRIAQIKEKFGTLRFYYDGGDEYISGMVRLAESVSAFTCEECGCPGTLRGSGWLRTLCETHAPKKEEDDEDEE